MRLGCLVLAIAALGQAGAVLPQQKLGTAVTVYNDNRALVRETRSLTLDKGTQEFSFVDVASQIDPTSVHFKSLTAPDAVEILEQNFQYDLVGTQRLLLKYVGQEIAVTTRDGRSFTGRLLSASQDAILQRTTGQVDVVSSAAIETISFPSLPTGLILKPTLVWLIENKKPGAHKVELSYLTEGMSWHAEYVGVSKQNDSLLELAGWVSIENTSGATYENATLKLVAGEVHRAERMPGELAMPEAAMTLALAKDRHFREEEFFEYHLYTLPRKTTIRDRETKQLALFPPATTPCKRLYLFDPRLGDKVRVSLEFVNSAQQGLGLPLPKGKVRVYKEAGDQALEFIGEDWIDHTPKDEIVRIYMGNAFDVVVERKQMATRKLGEKSREDTWQVSIRNHKKEGVTVTVVEHVWGEWEVRKSTHPPRRKDARTVEFDVATGAEGEAVLEYTILLRW
ncbi:MAG: DUF4139 domain-containing protein [candidate division KSB1 bacterium]|nr:DUF4139 domain-containing protein [candidate division KSB1 bacterium]MDZ7386311.1 DUF4139 domain-containing protein [candidate division KSB1 bacterium]MDZ7393337.1 DUF4139 domain-containing protein [candidate division KSB1 bacterium]MDZ7413286.1 DUF4139 domain-containing protein [candidate division KSB1 bacterium]